MEKPYRCRLQVSNEDADWPPVSRRRLLVIHGGPDLKIRQSESQTVAGRADATIAFGDFVLAIESKLGNEVTQAQLDRHIKTLSISQSPPGQIAWTTISKTLKALARQYVREPVTHFVLAQFEEYLNMSGYGALSGDHFAFFAQPDTARDPLVKDGIRRALGELGSRVKTDLESDWEVHVLNITKGTTSGGVLLRPIGNNNEPHLTIGIDASGINLFANVELQWSYQQFIRCWTKYPDGLIEFILKLGGAAVRDTNDIPWRFNVIHRVPLAPRKYHYWSGTDVTLTVMSSWETPFLQQFVENAVKPLDDEAAPEITIVKSYPSSSALHHENLPEMLSKDALELKPYFEWLGVALD